jgi:hypothetical protein
MKLLKLPFHVQGVYHFQSIHLRVILVCRLYTWKRRYNWQYMYLETFWIWNNYYEYRYALALPYYIYDRIQLYVKVVRNQGSSSPCHIVVDFTCKGCIISKAFIYASFLCVGCILDSHGTIKWTHFRVRQWRN